MSGVTLVLTGWREGLATIPLMRLLHKSGGINMVVAKHAVDDLLRGKRVEIALPELGDPEVVLQRIRVLGADAELAQRC